MELRFVLLCSMSISSYFLRGQWNHWGYYYGPYGHIKRIEIHWEFHLGIHRFPHGFRTSSQPWYSADRSWPQRCKGPHWHCPVGKYGNLWFEDNFCSFWWSSMHTAQDVFGESHEFSALNASTQPQPSCSLGLENQFSLPRWNVAMPAMNYPPNQTRLGYWISYPSATSIHHFSKHLLWFFQLYKLCQTPWDYMGLIIQPLELGALLKSSAPIFQSSQSCRTDVMLSWFDLTWDKTGGLNHALEKYDMVKSDHLSKKRRKIPIPFSTKFLDPFSHHITIVSVEHDEATKGSSRILELGHFHWTIRIQFWEEGSYIFINYHKCFSQMSEWIGYTPSHHPQPISSTTFTVALRFSSSSRALSPKFSTLQGATDAFHQGRFLIVLCFYDIWFHQ